MSKENSIGFSSGSNNSFQQLIEKIKTKNYYIDQNGQISDKNGTLFNKPYKCTFSKENNYSPFLLTENQLLENNIEFEPLLLYCYFNNLKCGHYLLYTLPHEVAHSIGFNGGI